MCSSFDGLCERGYPFRRTVKRNCQPRCVWIRDGISDRPSPPQVTAKPCERIGRERERKRGWIRTSSDLRASLEVSRSNRLRLSLPCRMLAGLRAREHFGFRRVPTIHRFPAPKSQCVSWIRSRLPLRGSPGVAPGSLLLSENTQRTSMGRSLLWHPIFVNSDGVGHGTIRFHQHDVAC